MSAYDKKYKFWVATKLQLENVILKQKILENVQAVDERFTAHCIHADMYCDYLDLVNKLGYIYHRTFQVQKRELLIRLLEAAGTRLCELRNELKNIELSEFIYIDRTLVQRKSTYDTVQLIRPDFFPFVRAKEIFDLIRNPRPKVEIKLTEEEEKKQKLAAKMGLDVNAVKEKELLPEQQRLRDAVLLIQTHERLRVKRIWRTNILNDPKKYLPTPDEFITKEKYIFTHRSDQEMLIPLKKTKYDGNYYKKSKPIGSFEFYSNPEIEKLDIKVAKMTSIYETANQNKVLEEIKDDIEEIQKDFDNQAAGDTLILHEKEKSITLRSVEFVDEPIYEQKVFLNDEQIKDNAARKIQGVWAGHLARKQYKKKLEKRAIFYSYASERKPIKNPLEQLMQRSYELKTIKDQYMLDFIKAVENLETRIIVKHSAGIMEDISDHIRFWIRDFFDITEELPPFPPEAKGGTILVLQNQTITPQEFIRKKTKTPAQLAAEAKKLKDDIKKEKQKLRQKTRQDARNEKAFMKKIAKEGKIYYDFEKIFTRNKSTKALEMGLNEANNKWYYDVDEKSNYKEMPFMAWISEEKFVEVHIELRKIVDQLMRLEYEKLRQAIAIDRKKKYKPPKAPKAKKEKQPKKQKKEIDLTENLTIQEIFYKMQDSGLIRTYPKRCFEEYFGDFNYCAYHLKNFFDLEVMPSTLEVRDILREWILGMGPLNLPKYKSILIGGPPQSAKVQLCEILASEIDAVMIDLSIETVAKYKDDIDMLIHLVQKMSRVLQPTIIFIENVHRTFWKKIPPEHKHLNPLILSKYLLKKIVKPIKTTEKLFVLATSDEPWAGSNKMNKIFEKIILMPKTDYSSSFMLWRKFILQNPGILRDFEFSPIASQVALSALHVAISSTYTFILQNFVLTALLSLLNTLPALTISKILLHVSSSSTSL